MQNHEIENNAAPAIQHPTLESYGVTVRQTLTAPTKPGKKPRPVWIVTGNVYGLGELFREAKGRKFRGEWSFFNDPCDEILAHLETNGRQSFAEQVENSIERKLEKAARYQSYAANAEVRAERSAEKASAIGAMIPMGQPILVGHHSERRHRKDIQRIEQSMQKSVEESRKAEYFSEKSARLARAESKPENREFVGNRIADAERELAQLLKWINPESPRLIQAQEKLDYWSKRLAEIEAKHETEGRAVASPETIKVGDLVWYIGSWLPVVRVNKKTVTVSHWLNIPTFNYKIEYTRISKFQSKPGA